MLWPQRKIFLCEFFENDLARESFARLSCMTNVFPSKFQKQDKKNRPVLKSSFIDKEKHTQFSAPYVISEYILKSLEMAPLCKRLKS
jgi:hypothetical protein